MSFTLPEELRLLKSNVRRFVNTQMIPVERETCAGDELKPVWKEKFVKGAKELGIWGLEIPEEYGGLGADILTRVAVWEELGRTIALALAEGDPKQAAIYGANLSGDADTVAAIACAMAGAYAGIEAFDPAVLAKLDADEVNAAYHIRDLAEGLYGLATQRHA